MKFFVLLRTVSPKRAQGAFPEARQRKHRVIGGCATHELRAHNAHTSFCFIGSLSSPCHLSPVSRAWDLAVAGNIG
jgi:hypothetical protein